MKIKAIIEFDIETDNNELSIDDVMDKLNCLLEDYVEFENPIIQTIEEI